jgi:hypothetical protein
MSLAQQTRIVKGSVDIVVCLDVTGSMAPCIEKLKTHIGRMVHELERGAAIEEYQRVIVSDWRIRILGFRDLRFTQHPAMIEDHPFVTTILDVLAQLADPWLRAIGGGGDGPESSLDALYRAASRSAWRRKEDAGRYVLLFTDAFPISRLHPSTVGQGPDDLKWLVQTLKYNKVRPILFAPRKHEYEVISEISPVLRGASRLFATPVETRKFFSGSDLEFAGIMELLGNTISSSLSALA